MKNEKYFLQEKLLEELIEVLKKNIRELNLKDSKEIFHFVVPVIDRLVLHIVDYFIENKHAEDKFILLKEMYDKVHRALIIKYDT